MLSLSMSASGGKADIDQPLPASLDLRVHGLTKHRGGSKKILGPSARDRRREPPLCELNFLGKNGEQQEIGYGRKRAPGGRWPVAVEMLMIVGTIPLQTGRATPLLIEVQGRSRLPKGSSPEWRPCESYPRG